MRSINLLLTILFIGSLLNAQTSINLENTGNPTIKHERRVFGTHHNHHGHSHSTDMKVPEQRTCLSVEINEEIREKYNLPSIEEYEAEFAILQREYLRKRQSNRSANTVIQIPVVVHVVHNGESVGSGPNISQAQVQSQIDVLNEDFRRKLNTPGYNTHPDGADVEIEFVMALRDPNGNDLAEPGIHRYNGNRSYWERNPIENTLKPNTYWDPNQYFNMWTMNFGGDTDGLLGYAQFPSRSNLGGISWNAGDAETDGVVIGYRYFGRVGSVSSPYDEGRTTTHEVGHWLGLRHIWGDGDCSDDDYCDDTPRSGEANGQCVQTNSCPSYPGNDMIENYMDYTPDACMNIFTEDQKTRMLTVMENSIRRKELKTSTVHLPLERAPIAEFSANNRNIMVGQSVNFTDLSEFEPTSWSWTFTGADITSSTNQNPTGITYQTPGCYEVSLTVTNNDGSDTESKTCYIVVTDENVSAADCGCIDESNVQSGESTSILSYGGDQGYYAGRNPYGDLHFAEVMANSGRKLLRGVKFESRIIHQNDPNAYITINIRNINDQNQLESVMYSQQVPFSDITSDGITSIRLNENVFIEDNFFVDLEIREGATDTIAFFMVDHRGDQGSNTMYLSDNSNWYTFEDVSVTYRGSMNLSAYLCDNFYTETVNACSGSVFTYADGTEVSQFTNGDSHESELITNSGCDSILLQIINVVNPSENTVNTTVCHGESFTTPEGTTLSSELELMSVVETLTNSVGCDSLVTYNLIELDANMTQVNVSICEGEDFITPEGILIQTNNGTGSYTETLNAANGCDSLVTYNVSEESHHVFVERNVCEGSDFTLMNGTTIQNVISDQSFEFTYTSINGCDSSVTEEIYVVTLDPTVTQDGDKLTSAMYGVEFQWLNCDKDLEEVEGATSRNFWPRANGNYAVRLRSNNCEVISECINFDGFNSVGTSNIDDQSITVYPNPATERLFIDIPSNETYQANVYDISGKLIESFTMNSENKSLEVGHYAKGDYFIQLSNDSSDKTISFTKN